MTKKKESTNEASDEGDPLSPEVLTVSTAAKRLTVSRWTIYELIRSGQLKSFKIGARRLIPAAAVQTLIKSRLAAEAA